MPVGYHGTLDHIAEKIVHEQKFKFSKKDTEWLGYGAYFFKYRDHAVAWARREAEKEKNFLFSPGLVRADLFFTEDQQLDLDDPEQLAEINAFMQDYLKAAPEVQVRWEKSNKWQRWCLSCNLYRRFYPEVKVISHTFNFNKSMPQSNTSGFNINQFQYCISDPSIIKNIRKEAL